MAVFQSTYPETMPVGAAGMIANMELNNEITRTASGAIGFGLPVIRVGDHNCILASLETLEAAGAAGSPAPAGATITASPTVGATAKLGVYNIVCIVAGATTTSKWSVEDPDGVNVGIATGNTAFTGGGLTFTITDSGTDPAVGEAFTVTVTASVATDDLDVLGLSVRNIGLGHSSSPDSYAQYDNVAIMTKGVMWVIAGATVTAGGDVYWIVGATGKYTNVAGAGNLRIPGAKFDSGGADTEFVKVAIR